MLHKNLIFLIVKALLAFFCHCEADVYMASNDRSL